MPTKRTSESGRGYLGEPVGSALAAWMNRDKWSLRLELMAAGPDWRELLSEKVKRLVDSRKGKRLPPPGDPTLDVTAQKGLLSQLGPHAKIAPTVPSPSPAAVKRVEEIISLLQAAYLQPGSRGSIFALAELEARLSSYKLESQVGWYEGRIRLVSYVPSDRNGEGAAIWRLFELSRQGLFDRLRRCSWCNRWLFAHFKSQLFCSARCRKTHRERSDEYKAYRRGKAREYYAKEKAHAKKR